MTLKLGKFTNFKALSPAVSKAFFEGLIFWGAYIRRGLCTEVKDSFSKSIGPACSGKEIYHFCFVLLRLRVVPHFSSGIVDRAKRERT